MKKKINEILQKGRELKNCENLIFEKENDILSCIKSINQDGIRSRQKQAAVSLLNLKKEKETLKSQLVELCKGLDISSFKNKKVSSKLISDCISNGINNEDLKSLKNVFKSI